MSGSGDWLVAGVAGVAALGFAALAATGQSGRLPWRPVRQLRRRRGEIATRLFLALIAAAMGAASVAIANDWRPSYVQVRD